MVGGWGLKGAGVGRVRELKVGPGRSYLVVGRAPSLRPE